MTERREFRVVLNTEGIAIDSKKLAAEIGKAVDEIMGKATRLNPSVVAMDYYVEEVVHAAP